MAKKSGASVGAVELEEKPSRIGLPADIAWRSRRESRNDFLRCQFGRRVHETRRMSVRMGSGAVVEHTLPVTLFYLLGYGRTWDAAKEMTMKRLGLFVPVAEANGNGEITTLPPIPEVSAQP